MDDIETCSQRFDRASAHARFQLQNISDDAMLQLYGLYKQAKEGPCTVPKPYFYEFVAKAKWEAWKKLGEMTKLEAMRSYISLVKKLDSAYDELAEVEADSFGAGKKTRHQLGIAVSTMYQQEVAADCANREEEETVLDWCKDGNMAKLVAAIENDKSLLRTVDGQGLTLLHWASDRGCVAVVEYLIKCGADINAQDHELQSPLHYAASCDRSDISILLLEGGADVHLKDDSGLTPFDVADSQALRNLIAQFRDQT